MEACVKVCVHVCACVFVCAVCVCACVGGVVEGVYLPECPHILDNPLDRLFVNLFALGSVIFIDWNYIVSCTRPLCNCKQWNSLIT